MNWRVMRQLFVVFGTYFVASWIGSWLDQFYAMTMPSFSYSPDDIAAADEPTPRRGRTAMLVLVWATLSFVVGAFIAVSVTTAMMLHATDTVSMMFMNAIRSQYADMQFREATYDAAKKALTDHAAYLEGLKPQDPKQPDRPCETALMSAKHLAWDRMMVYAELAITEERVQHADVASSWWTRAEEQAQQLTWKDPTRETIRNRLRSLTMGPMPKSDAGAAPR